MNKIIFYICLIIFSSCLLKPESSSLHYFPEKQWSAEDILHFNYSFKSPKIPYQFYFILTHTNKYPYKNIWIQWQWYNNNGLMVDSTKFELPLAEDQTGWLGIEFDNVITHKVLLNQQPLYFDSGQYQVILKQIMRDTLLPDISLAGLLIKKINHQ